MASGTEKEREGRRIQSLLSIFIAGLLAFPNGPLVASSLAQELVLSKDVAPTADSRTGATTAIAAQSAVGAPILFAPGAPTLTLPLSAIPAAPNVQTLPAQAANVPTAAPAAAASPELTDGKVPAANPPSVAAPTTEKKAAVDPNSSIPDAGVDGEKVFDGAQTQLTQDVLGPGTRQNDGQRIQPFIFHAAQMTLKARGSGLEGFLYSKKEIEGDLGKNSILHHLDDYFSYLTALLTPASAVPAAAKLLSELKTLQAQPVTATEKDAQLEALLGLTVAKMQKQLIAAQPSSWIRNARTYEIFIRAHNMPGWREMRGLPAGSPDKKFFQDFSASDLSQIKKDFDAVWVMGVFPIGERNRKGSAGGSPYSIKDHTAVNPDFGTEADFKAFVARAHQAGLKVIMDFVPNHTSPDSKLLDDHPEYFIHREVEGDPRYAPDGYFPYYSKLWGRWLWISYGGYDYFGQLAHWTDTAQLDYSRQDVRDAMSGIVADWVARTGVDGFRVDMAYQLTNTYFSRLWKRGTPPGEFLEQLTRTVRARFPGTAFIAEIYDLRSEISAMGVNALYNKNSMDTSSGQYGWYDAWMQRDVAFIRNAIRDVSFMIGQKASAIGWQFIGNHDESSPQRQELSGDHPVSGLGKAWKAAALLTLMLPGGLLFYGSQEAGFDRPDPMDFPKSISFQTPVSVDWKSHPEITAFFDQTFAQAREARLSLGQAEIEHLEPKDGAPWVGYLLKPTAASPKKDHFYAVFANPTDQDVQVHLQRPDLGVDFTVTVAPGDGQVFSFPIRSL